MRLNHPRNQFLDYAKGVLIFLVTLGHVIQGVIYANAGFYEDGLFKAIYLFHMPLFMALAGYVAFGSLQRSPALPFAARRAVNLLLPVFTRTLIEFSAGARHLWKPLLWQPVVFLGVVFFINYCGGGKKVSD